MVQSYFEVDVNCSKCLNAIIDALSATDGVDEVEAHASKGCLVVKHRLDESAVQALVTSVGHTVEVAGNGELVMGESHARAMHRCNCPP